MDYNTAIQVVRNNIELLEESEAIKIAEDIKNRIRETLDYKREIIYKTDRIIGFIKLIPQKRGWSIIWDRKFLYAHIQLAIEDGKAILNIHDTLVIANSSGIISSLHIGYMARIYSVTR